MTSLGRTYGPAGTLLVFFVLWAAIAASPWAAHRSDPRLEALTRREAIVRHAARDAQRAHAARWARYRGSLAEQQELQAAVATTPQVRIVQVQPAVTTRSS